jgi:hypothetical protein
MIDIKFKSKRFPKKELRKKCKSGAKPLPLGALIADLQAELCQLAVQAVKMRHNFIVYLDKHAKQEPVPDEDSLALYEGKRLFVSWAEAPVYTCYFMDDRDRRMIVDVDTPTKPFSSIVSALYCSAEVCKMRFAGEEIALNRQILTVLDIHPQRPFFFHKRADREDCERAKRAGAAHAHRTHDRARDDSRVPNFVRTASSSDPGLCL